MTALSPSVILILHYINIFTSSTLMDYTVSTVPPNGAFGALDIDLAIGYIFISIFFFSVSLQ